MNPLPSSLSAMPSPPLSPALARARNIFSLSDQQTNRLSLLITEIQRHAPGTSIRLNDNRQTLLSLRGHRGAMTASIHAGFLDDDHAIPAITAWVTSAGRERTPALTAAMDRAWQIVRSGSQTGRQTGRRTIRQTRAQHLSPEALLALTSQPTIGIGFDLQSCFKQIFARYFGHLADHPAPIITWARSGRSARLRHIRFGSYRRPPQAQQHSTPALKQLAQITINPRLNQPWIATVFVEHVIFHELCHHRQTCEPIRGEFPHSPRFRTWEHQFPQHHTAIAWERHHLPRLLDDLNNTADPSFGYAIATASNG